MPKTAWYALGALAAVYLLTKPRSASAGVRVSIMDPPPADPVELAANIQNRTGLDRY